MLTAEEAGESPRRPPPRRSALGCVLAVLFLAGVTLLGRDEGQKPGAPPPMPLQPAAGQITAVKYNHWFAYSDDEFLNSLGGKEAFGLTLSQTAPGENVAEIGEVMTILIDRGEPKIVSRGRRIPRRDVRPMRMPWRQTFEVSGTSLNAAEILYTPPASASDQEKSLARK